MLNCCMVCHKLDGVTGYKERVSICGKCRECTKYDMSPYAEEQEPIEETKELFGGKRWNKGKQSKIPTTQRNMIIRLYKTGKYTQSQLAKLYGVSQYTISRVVNEKN